MVAVRLEPAAAAGLVAGHRSREPGHRLVLVELGREPLLDLRIRAARALAPASRPGCCARPWPSARPPRGRPTRHLGPLRERAASASPQGTATAGGRSGGRAGGRPGSRPGARAGAGTRRRAGRGHRRKPKDATKAKLSDELPSRTSRKSSYRPGGTSVSTWTRTPR
ncbi:nicotinate-nucleotide--dimethylbenzimidazole phosphoribosyltransferase [Saccharothrix sp. BKS2]|uniref:nicotinate-nucleotide--dimethylbenzimidazole phosphoribosyltransferase n=1 Tax=Saccharothrix sp. BKS2 TaxID=3064400 RepID=UPI0039EB8FE3